MFRAVGTIIAAYLGYTYGDDVVNFVQKLVLHEGGGRKDDEHVGVQEIRHSQECMCIACEEESVNQRIAKESSFVALAPVDGAGEIGTRGKEVKRTNSGLLADCNRKETNLEDERLKREHGLTFKSGAERARSLFEDDGQKREGESLVEGKMYPVPFC